jgi:TPR repeat protein
MNAVAASEDRALRLFHRAAEQRDSTALLRIGDYYYYGRAALTPSAVQAAKYYKLSAGEGKNGQVAAAVPYVCVPFFC